MNIGGISNITYLPAHGRLEDTLAYDTGPGNMVVDAMIHYLTDHTQCRNETLLNYFDEAETNRCGICDVCLRRNKLEVSDIEFENIIEQLKNSLNKKQIPFNQLLSEVHGVNEEKLLHTIRWLIDQNMITENESHQFQWK